MLNLSCFLIYFIKYGTYARACRQKQPQTEVNFFTARVSARYFNDSLNCTADNERGAGGIIQIISESAYFIAFAEKYYDKRQNECHNEREQKRISHIQ